MTKKTMLLFTIIFTALAFFSCDAILTSIDFNESEITTKTIWGPNQEVNLNSTIYVKAELIIDRCTEVVMSDNGYIYVQDGGSIKVNGTADCPVKFTSSKFSPSKGDWRYISIEESASSGNVFNHVVFEYGGNTGYGAVIVEKGPSVSITNAKFSNIEKIGLTIKSGADITAFTGNSFKNIGEELINEAADTVQVLDPIVSTDNDNDYVMVDGTDTDDDGTWKNLGVPYRTETFSIKSDITIEKGTTIMLEENGYIYVEDEGTLKTEGTADEAVTFTSFKSAPSNGDWRYISIEDSAGAGNEFNYTRFEYGGDTGYGMFVVEDGASAKFMNCSFAHSDKYGVSFEEGARIEGFSGNSFDDIKEGIVKVSANGVASLDPVTSTADKDNYILVDGGDVTDDGNWQNLSVPLKLETISINAAVTVEAGTVIQMSENAYLYVNDEGSLVLDGTADDHVVVTSPKSNPSAGDWRYIGIEDSASAGSRFTYTDISYGGDTGYGQLAVDDGAEITLEHVTFSDAEECDISIDDGATVNDTDSTFDVCE